MKTRASGIRFPDGNCPSPQCSVIQSLQGQINQLRGLIAQLRRDGDARQIRNLQRRLRRLQRVIRNLAPGVPGPAGPAGPAGPPGTTTSGLAAYGNVFNTTTGLLPLTIAAGADIPFSSNGVLNNVTHTPGAAEIVLPLAGDYEVIFQVNAVGGLAALLSAFAVTVNGVVVPQSTFAINLLGVLDLSAQISGAAIITVPAGATVTLRNVSGVPVPLVNTLIGAVTPFNNASLTIKKLDPVA